LLPAVGGLGVEFTITFTVPAGLLQPDTVITREYTPAARVLAPITAGFCTLDVKLFGPLQEYAAAPFGRPVRLMFWPEQMGELLVGVGAAGIGLTVTLIVPGALTQVPDAAVTE
jgi:hypothetical protein